MNNYKDDNDAEEEEPDEDSDDNDDDMDIDYEGFAFLQEDITYSLQDKPGILAIWILLDSQLMVDVFSINKPLTNIRDSKCTITLYCNARKAIITQKGDLKGYGMLWYYPEDIANILSLSNVKKKYKVAYDISMKTGFIVHKADGSNHVIMPSKKGLYFSDVKNDIAHFMINTVDSTKIIHT